MDDIALSGTPAGAISVTVKDVDGNLFTGAASVSRYNSSFVFLDSKSTSGGVASWPNVPTGIYNLEVYSNGEFWGAAQATVTQGNTTNVTIQRTEPYATAFVTKLGLTDVTGGTIPAESSLSHEVTVRNSTAVSQSVRVLLRVDRSKSNPYDFEETSTARTISSGSTRTFSFNHTPTTAGTYYRSLEVQTSVSGTWVKTDSWAWGEPLTVTQLHSPTITKVAPSGDEVSIATGQSINFQTSCGDQDGNLADVNWYVDGVLDHSTSISGASATPSWNRTFPTAGTFNIGAQVGDTTGRSSELAWIVTVTAPCSYTLSPTSASPGFGASSGSFTVTTGGSCTWLADSDATSWLHTTSGTTGSGTVTYTYDLNPSTSPRIGHIRLGNQTFTVTQSAASDVNACDRQDLALEILKIERPDINGIGIELAKVHSEPLDPLDPDFPFLNSTARQNILDTAKGGRARTSDYGHSAGVPVWLDPRMLDGINRLAQTYSFSVSEVAGGRHSTSDSKHYDGLAFDVNYIGVHHVNSLHPDVEGFTNLCYSMGARRAVLENDNHIHVDWADGENVACTDGIVMTGTSGGGLRPPSNGQFQFEVSTPNHQQVIIQASEDLVNWFDVGPVTIENGKGTFTDNAAGDHAKRFYRPKP